MAIPAIVLPFVQQGLNLVSGAIMAKGKKWVEDKTGLDLDENNLTPEQVLALKQFEKESEAELLRIMLSDLSDARDMQKAALGQNDIFSKRFIYYFASFWSTAAVLYIACITFLEVPQANERFADTVLGFVLGTVIATIIGFFYGSSAGSKEKDLLMRELSGHSHE
jgi:hypothetical protein